MGRVAGEQVLEGGVGVSFGHVTSEAITTSFHKDVSGCWACSSEGMSPLETLLGEPASCQRQRLEAMSQEESPSE